MNLRDGLQAVPLGPRDCDIEYFMDRCCYKGPEGNVASYAVCQWQEGRPYLVESGVIPQPASAQVAEIVALTRALQLSGPTHIGKAAMLRAVQKLWWSPFLKETNKFNNKKISG